MPSTPTSLSEQRGPWDSFLNLFKKSQSITSMTPKPCSTKARADFDQASTYSNESDSRPSDMSKGFYMNIDNTSHIMRQTILEGEIFTGDRVSEGDSSRN